MTELATKAEKYASEKTNEMITKAIAQAYADGYRQGYKDREDEIPVDLRENKTKFVDLGLPSGTLWADSFEKDGEYVIYSPYEKAELLEIPTIEQWNELMNLCKWDFVKDRNGALYRADCAGPNGRVISFFITGLINAIEKRDYNESFFWVKADIDGNTKKAVHIFRPYIMCEGKLKYISNVCTVALQNSFSGYKLPIRLVKTKKEE